MDHWDKICSRKSMYIDVNEEMIWNDIQTFNSKYISPAMPSLLSHCH
jgi:hypothetical protein